MRFIMYYSSSDTSDMQIRIFLGNFLRYTKWSDKKLSFWIRSMSVISLKLKNISTRIPPPLFSPRKILNNFY